VCHFIQAAFGLNFHHYLAELTDHIATVVATAIDEGITSIEATEEAEEAWLGLLWNVGKGFGRYSAACTPSFHNSEGARTMEAARNVVHPGNLMRYVEHLERWREAGDMPGTVVVRAAAEPADAPA
jgi:hypothetical protein